MNFYDELENNCKEAGIKGKKVSIPDDLKPTKKDYAKLDKNIEIRTEANRKMMILSEQYASSSMPASKSKNKSLRKCMK